MLQAYGKQVLVKFEKPEDVVKKGNVFLLNNQSSENVEYVVASVGHEVEGIQTGDTVITHAYHGSSLTYQDQMYKSISYEQILAVVKND